MPRSMIGLALLAALAGRPAFAQDAAVPATAADSLATPADSVQGSHPDVPDAAAARAPLHAPAPARDTGVLTRSVLRADRLQHASLSLCLGIGAGLLTRRPATGAGAAFGIGIAKELTDDHADGVDLLADAAGALLSALVVASLTRR